MLLKQSVATLQALAAAHGPHKDPPQSTSLSPGSSVWFWQDAGTHSAASQMPVAQSPLLAQLSPAGHLPQFEPPQSTSLSSPFLRPSLHLAWLQRPSVQTKLTQSSLKRQSPPDGQRVGVHVSPQSVSDSLPLRTPSSHFGAAQAPLLHTPDAQSRGTRQVWPVTHGVQLPPQS